MATEWAPDPRPVPEELTEGYQAEPYVAPEPPRVRNWSTIADRLDPALIRELAGWASIGEPLTPEDLTAREREAVIAAGKTVIDLLDRE